MTRISAIFLIPVFLTLLGWKLRIFPTQRMVVVALVTAAASLVLLAAESSLPWLLLLDGAALLAICGDLLTIPRWTTFAASRTLQRVASLQKAHSVTLTVENRGSRTLEIDVRDDVPASCLADIEEFYVVLAPRSRIALRYTLRAKRRGAFGFQFVYLRVLSRLKLWRRHCSYRVDGTLHVYPDMLQLREYALLARTDRLSLAGVRRMRRIGQDNEFERLRDYTLDDNYKHIEWRSTARRGKLTVKDFQMNQSQRVIFLMDCGRMMTNAAAGISLLDHAFNATLMLAYVALHKGDSVGMICFSDELSAFVPPRGGMSQMNRLLHASFDRFPRMVESRYDQAFLYLNTHCTKRSLVVLITNVIDEVNAHQLSRYLAVLVGRHLPLGILLRDRALFEAAEHDPEDEATLYRAAAAQEIVGWRRNVLADMASRGVLTLDVFPDQLTAPLVNRYLQIKARHLL